MTLRLGLSMLAYGFVVVRAFGGTAAAEPASRVSGPATHGNVAVYFVHGTSLPGPVPDTLQEALAKGTVEVQETGNVQELKIENKGQTPVFVQFGDIVKGGQQDRVLTISMVLQPGSGVVPIGAYCVEKGRWSARGKEDVKRFALSEALIPSREAKIAMSGRTKPAASDQAGPARQAAGTGSQGAAADPVVGNLRQQRPASNQAAGNQAAGNQAAGGQSEVWRSVAEVQSGLTASLAAPVASATSTTSLQLALEHEKLKEAQASYLAALEPAGLNGDDIVGVAIAVNGRLSSADVYPSNGLFRKMWPKLARAAATEALSGNKQADAAKAGTGTPPSIDTVTAFLAEAETGKASEVALGTHAKIETRASAKAVRMVSDPRTTVALGIGFRLTGGG